MGWRKKERRVYTCTCSRTTKGYTYILGRVPRGVYLYTFQRAKASILSRAQRGNTSNNSSSSDDNNNNNNNNHDHDNSDAEIVTKRAFVEKAVLGTMDYFLDWSMVSPGNNSIVPFGVCPAYYRGTA